MLDAVTPALGAAVTGYGLVAGASSLLQARRMLRRGTSSDVSLTFLGLYVAGYALWLLYGLAIGSLPLILVDAVGLLAGGATLAVASLLRRGDRPAPPSRVGAPRIGRPVAFHRSPSDRPRRAACGEPIRTRPARTSPGRRRASASRPSSSVPRARRSMR